MSSYSTATVRAQDECKDVLVNAVMNTLAVTKDNYYNTAILSTVNEQSDSSSDTSAGLGVVIEGIPISLSYSDAKRLKSSISKYYSLNSIARERSSYLLMSGQDVIVNAWKDCMTKRGGGLSLRFKPLDGRTGKQTLLYIEYYKSADPTQSQLNLQLTDAPYLDKDEIEVKSGLECLKAGKVFRPGDTCTVLFLTKSAWTTMPFVMAVKTQPASRVAASPAADAEIESNSIISYSVYLAPRAELVGKSRPWPQDGPARTKETYSYDNAVISSVECFKPTDGYFLLKRL